MENKRSLIDKDALCPECGCPPRFIIGSFRVRVRLCANGTEICTPVNASGLVDQQENCILWNVVEATSGLQATTPE